MISFQAQVIPLVDMNKVIDFIDSNIFLVPFHTHLNSIVLQIIGTVFERTITRVVMNFLVASRASLAPVRLDVVRNLHISSPHITMS